jgi:hypothetical protein
MLITGRLRVTLRRQRLLRFRGVALACRATVDTAFAGGRAAGAASSTARAVVR